MLSRAIACYPVLSCAILCYKLPYDRRRNLWQAITSSAERELERNPSLFDGDLKYAEMCVADTMDDVRVQTHIGYTKFEKWARDHKSNPTGKTVLEAAKEYHAWYLESNHFKKKHPQNT